MADVVWTPDHLNVVNFCAQECWYQHSGERSVAHMLEAWIYARQYMHKPLKVDDVLRLGRLVEPGKNSRGWREVNVQVSGNVLGPWYNVPRQMMNLCEAWDRLTPAEFFKEYEEIHPFLDGNGRTGQILFNWLSGTLDTPEWAPNFWEDARRG